MIRNLYRQLTGHPVLDEDSERIVRGFVDNFVKNNNLSLAAGAAIQIGWPELIETDEMRQAVIDQFKRIGFSVTMDDYPQIYQIHIVEVKNIKARHPLMRGLRSLRQELYKEAGELVVAYIKQNVDQYSVIFPSRLGRYNLSGDTPYSRQLRKVFNDVFYNKTRYRLSDLNDTHLREYYINED